MRMPRSTAAQRSPVALTGSATSTDQVKSARCDGLRLRTPRRVFGFSTCAVRPVDDDGLDAFPTVHPHGFEYGIGIRNDAATLQTNKKAQRRYRVNGMPSIEARVDKLVFLEKEQERAVSNIARGERLKDRDLADVLPVLLQGDATLSGCNAALPHSRLDDRDLIRVPSNPGAVSPRRFASAARGLPLD